MFDRNLLAQATKTSLQQEISDSETEDMSGVMRKPDFCICKNKGADQVRDYHAADQRFCFHYIDSAIPLLPKSEISNLYPSSKAVQPGLCWTWSETPKTGFVMTRLILYYLSSE